MVSKQEPLLFVDAFIFRCLSCISHDTPHGGRHSSESYHFLRLNKVTVRLGVRLTSLTDNNLGSIVELTAFQPHTQAASAILRSGSIA